MCLRRFRYASFSQTAANSPGYDGLAVTERCGPIDDSLSAEVILPPQHLEDALVRGCVCVFSESWDGSDISTAGGYAGSFVVAPVKDALENAHHQCVLRAQLRDRAIWRADGSIIASE